MTIRFLLILCCAGVFQVFGQNSFDRANREVFQYDAPQLMTHVNTSDEQLITLSTIRYWVETSNYHQAFAALKRVKRNIRISDQEVKGVYNLVLARLYYRIGNQKQAVSTNKEAIADLLAAKSIHSLQLAFINHAFFYANTNWQKAEQYLSKAEDIREKGVRDYEALLYSNRAFLALMRNAVSEAEMFANRLDQLLNSQKCGGLDRYRLCILRASIAEMKKDKSSEEQWLADAKVIAMRYGIMDNWKQVANSQSVNALESGQIGNAYWLLREKDSIANLLPNQEISEFLTKMKLDEQLEIEQKEKSWLKSSLSARNKALIVVVLFLVLVTAILFVVFVQQRSIRKKLRLLVKQHVERSRKVGFKSMEKEVNLELIQQLEKVIQEKEVFQQANLTLDRLAKKLNTNRTYLSECINAHYQMNYSQWIARVRIDAACAYFLDQAFDHWSIEGVSQSVGFSSISSFNATFKREKGVTPSQFRKMSKEFN